MTSPQEREKFEAWCVPYGIDPARCLPGDDMYRDEDARIAWASWQAARSVPAEQQEPSESFPFYELKFIMRVLGHEGSAPKEDWQTAYGMARDIFTRWQALQVNNIEVEP